MFSQYNTAYCSVLYPKFKNFDLFYKTNQNFFFNTSRKNKSSVNLSIIFKNTKLSSRLAMSVFGFGLQFFLAGFVFSKFSFGFKVKLKFNCFRLDGHSFFNSLNFFFYANFVYKAICLGIFQSFFKHGHLVKFFVSDIFNFFGIRFFSKFYLDFFDWPVKLVFTYFIPSNFNLVRAYPLFFSIFKVSF